jgi:hypothetical protein
MAAKIIRKIVTFPYWMVRKSPSLVTVARDMHMH